MHSVANSVNGEYSLTVSKFNGRETLWKETIKENKDIEIDFDLSLLKGQAKIVYIDSEDHVTTLIECLPETSTDGFVTQFFHQNHTLASQIDCCTLSPVSKAGKAISFSASYIF